MKLIQILFYLTIYIFSEKGPYKNPEFTSIDPPNPTSTTLHASRYYVKNVLREFF